MPCGKKPLVKNWDKPRNIRVITPSVYEQNEASVKVHWKKVIKDLELSYKDDQFWETQCNTVRELVGPQIFHRLAKIFKLPLQATQYMPESEMSSLVPSETFYISRTAAPSRTRPTFSMDDFEPYIEEEEHEEEEEMEEWSSSSVSSDAKLPTQSKSIIRSKSFSIAKSISRIRKSYSKIVSKTMMTKSFSAKMSKSHLRKSVPSTIDESTATDDDIIVHPSTIAVRRYTHRLKNPHFQMLYCNASETDMIKWKSKYKQKVFEVSASDGFSKKAEITTKKIAKEFYEWWVGLGNVEFKSEIKRPEDIEDLFQVWFDEHASRGLVLDPKILPCVLQSIADYVQLPMAACPEVLKRQIASDIHAETSPEHTVAFGTCLPQRMKHIPPKNNTEKMWHCVVIPEDLRTMACVWEDISHLTSTKDFHKWLKKRPLQQMPPYLASLDGPEEKKQPFVVPSDFVLTDKSSTSSTPELALPVSHFELELKEVLSKLMNQ